MTSHPFVATPGWVDAFPGATVATLTVRETANPATSESLDLAKRALETELKERWFGKNRGDIRAHPVLATYGDYYKKFGQNYHVQMQIESIALKNKTIPSRAALVEAMFMAELATGILTAVHDLDQIVGPVQTIHTNGEERYIRYDGVEESCKPGDMAMCDDIGILTSVIQGPTTHARVTPETTNAFFCLYAPSGIDDAIVRRHLELIADYVRMIKPDSVIEDAIILTC